MSVPIQSSLSASSSSLLLDETLRNVARRYRLPDVPAVSSQTHEASPAMVLAIAIEHARDAVTRGEAPDPALKQLFVDALARMIHHAMRNENGDPVFQAMVLRHRAARVREFASLSAHADRDRRVIHASVNAIAHPAKQQRILPGPQREALAQLEAAASSPSWAAFDETVRRLVAIPEIANEAPLQRALLRLLDSAALRRLLRIEALASDEEVRHYQSLWVRHGPRSGSSAAVAQGAASQQRGAAAEAQATQALTALAARLNEAEREPAAYRVATSMRVPSSIPASHERAKSEWDAVLLRRANGRDEAAEWDVCLLVEAKASVDAATIDFARLVRGLRLLAHAQEDAVYSFETEQGVVAVRGASLSALPVEETEDATSESGANGTSLQQAVLYCCNAPAETAARLLSAASRMQLLSAQASLQFADALMEKQSVQPLALEPVWDQLLESPQWRALLNQYSTLRQVRELMVHPDDLLAAINGEARTG